MTEWWTSLEPAMKVLWAVTLSASLVFVIQTVMTFLGAAGDSDFDINSDFDTDAPGDISDGSVDAGGHDATGHDTGHAGGGMNLLTFRTSSTSCSASAGRPSSCRAPSRPCPCAC